MLGKSKSQRPDSPAELAKAEAKQKARDERASKPGSGLRVLVICVAILAIAGVGVGVVSLILGAKDIDNSNDPTKVSKLASQTQSAWQWPKLQSWNGLRQGMTKAEVRELFGTPMSTAIQPNKIEVWSFNDASILGSGASAATVVYFEVDGRVCAWTRPRATLE